jgi:hypothetical protein
LPLALAAADAAAGFAFTPPADTPSEEEIVASMATAMPSPAPTAAEFAARRRLPREEQLRRIRRALDHPGADAVSPDSMDDGLDHF